MNALVELELRMCPECGVAFQPVTWNQVYCCPKHKDAWCREHPMDKTTMSPCARCGKLFHPVGGWHVFCSDNCKRIARYERERADPIEVEKNKRRSAEWYQRNKDHHKVKVTEYRKASSEVEQQAVVPETPAPPIDPWSLPSPSLGYLPGGFVSVSLSPERKLRHEQLSCLHGIMTAVTGPHAPHVPRFSLLPWPKGCGWAAYLAEDSTAREVASHGQSIMLDRTDATVTLGPLVRVKAPVYPPGKYRIRVEAITPIHIRAYGSTVIRSTPTARHLRGTLEGFMPRRLGLEVPPGNVALDLLEMSTSQDYVKLNGRVREFGRTSGWIGHVVVETNAVGRFLLQCCALGMGYGGKVAFGFGRIRVTEITP
jgi:hypothetical protein